MTAADLQNLVNDRYANAGGLIQLGYEYIEFDKPILLPAKISLSGMDYGTRFVYHGPGAPFLLSSVDTVNQTNQRCKITNLAIWSDSAGIGIDEQHAPKEGSGLTIRDVAIECTGKALNLRHANGQWLYNVGIDNVSTVSGGPALDLLAVGYSIHRLDSVPIKPLLGNDSGVRLSGGGIFAASRIEGDFGGPMVEFVGKDTGCNVQQVHIEPHRKDGKPRDTVLINGAKIVVDDTGSWFAQIAGPTRTINGGELNCATKLGTHDGSTVKQAYPCDLTGKVFERGVLVVGTVK